MFLLALILGTAVLIWAAVLLRYGHLLAGCLAVLLAGSCFGHPFFHASGITIDRLVLAGLVVVYGAYRQLGWTERRPWGLADGVIGTFVAILAISTFVHDWQGPTQPVGKLLSFYLLPGLLYVVAREMPLDERRVKAMLVAFAVFGVYLGVTAVAEDRDWWWLVYPRYIASPKFEEFYGRGRGPFLNPVSCGIFLATCGAAALLCWPRATRFGRLAIVVVLAVVLAGSYSTLTRSVWLGGGLALGLVTFLLLPRPNRRVLAVFAGLAGVFGIGAKYESATAFQRDKHVSVEQMAESAKLRPVLAAVAWRMFREQPLWGCGYGQYPLACRTHLGDRSSDLPLEKARPYVQHNVFLALLTEVGLIGAGLFAFLLLLWARDAWRIWRSASPLWTRQPALLLLALLGTYVVNGLFHDVALVAMVHMLLFFVGGVCVNLRASPGPDGLRRAAASTAGSAWRSAAPN